jgi:hypothetical protein
MHAERTDRAPPVPQLLPAQPIADGGLADRCWLTRHRAIAAAAIQLIPALPDNAPLYATGMGLARTRG